MNEHCLDNQHDLLQMQDRLMDKLASVDPDIATEFKYFTRLYRSRFLRCKQCGGNHACTANVELKTSIDYIPYVKT